MKEAFLIMSNTELARYLLEYSRKSSGEIAALTYAAYAKITALVANVAVLEDDREKWRGKWGADPRMG